MKNTFLRKMMSAGRLTSRGRLVEASAAIQRALAGAARAAPIRAPSPKTARATVGAAAAAASAAAAAWQAVRPAATMADAPVHTKPEVGARFAASSYTGAGGTRAFKLFSPAGFDGARLPLVVMLHGCTQTPDDFAAGTRMNELAQRRGFYVLYPEQAARSNAQRCWNWFSPADQRRGAGEPALIAGMTRHVMATHPVDTDRVFVAGLSAGGAMAAILAREYPDLIAAAGVHSGLPPGAAHDVASAFAAMKSGPGASAPPGKAGSAPVIVFHGTADATVAPINGEAVAAAVTGGAAGAVRAEERGSAGRGRTFRRVRWHAGGGDAAAVSLAEHWVVDGAPHAWSGGAAAGSYTDPAGPDASAEMVRFFFEHPRRAAA